MASFIGSKVPRVVSVLPSATEMLCFIGAESMLVGRSHEDNFPPSITHLPILTGGTTAFGPQPDGSFTEAAVVDAQVSASIAAGDSLYTIDEPLLRSLRPDVVLTQDVCRVCAIDLATVERLAAKMTPPPKVVSLNPECFADVLDNVLELGAAVGRADAAAAARAALDARCAAVDARTAALDAAGAPRPSVAFLEWSDPVYVGGHWTPELIERAGGRHPLNPPTPGGGGAGKSFAVAPETILASAPDVVVIAPCGLALDLAAREAGAIASADWFGKLPEHARARVAIADGDAMFNRPGPRLVDALEWLEVGDASNICGTVYDS